MKKILVTYFTQSGQLKQILDSVMQAVIAAGHEVEFLQVKPQQAFPFPWYSKEVFFDTVPESVNRTPVALEPWQTSQDQYDLVILGWQPWNLAPSIPFNSLMQDEKFKALIKDTPVITVSGCRNMWINAQEQNKQLIKAAGALLVGNIVLTDRHLNHLSYFTIFHWLGTGKKTRKWGIFPKPGVSDADIKEASKYGTTIVRYLQTGDTGALQPALVAQGAAPVKYSLMYIESKAGKIFQKWVNIIQKHPGKRTNILVAYRIYLAIALLIASPIILLANTIFVRPFTQQKISKKIAYLKSVAIK